MLLACLRVYATIKPQQCIVTLPAWHGDPRDGTCCCAGYCCVHPMAPLINYSRCLLRLRIHSVSFRKCNYCWVDVPASLPCYASSAVLLLQQQTLSAPEAATPQLSEHIERLTFEAFTRSFSRCSHVASFCTDSSPDRSLCRSLRSSMSADGSGGGRFVRLELVQRLGVPPSPGDARCHQCQDGMYE